MVAARERQNQLTKPLGSLAGYERRSRSLITSNVRPRLPRKAVGNGGRPWVCAEGGLGLSSGLPQMVMNFLAGGAAINVLSRRAGARVVVVDVGIAAEMPVRDGLLNRKVARGSRNLSKEPAMTQQEAEQAIQVGIDVVEMEIAKGLDLVATGEMGIGNTTPSAAIVSLLTGYPLSNVVGRGTGVDDTGLERKIVAIERGIAANKPNPSDPMDVLIKMGGLEIAGLVGVILAGAANRLPGVIDGFISGAAALVAVGLCPRVKDYLCHPTNRSRPDTLLYSSLKISPLPRYGYALARHRRGYRNAPDRRCLAIHDEMVTFAEAGVSGKAESE